MRSTLLSLPGAEFSCLNLVLIRTFADLIQMKIYILSVKHQFQPRTQPFKYPKHNRDFGVEQDFLKYLLKHKELVAENPATADWHYLPIYWTKWHLNHDFGKSSLLELQREVNRLILDDSKTFTICQYDDGPLVDLGGTLVFFASRKTIEGIDIPLLCATHRKPLFEPLKKYLASFMGRLSNHPIRQEMAECLRDRDDVYIYDGTRATRDFVYKTLESDIALCPRGYGGSSFRFFEAMQLGVVPFLIGDLDTRPFKKFINWDELSLFSQSASELNDILDSLQKADLRLMGKKAAEFWKKELTYQRWCKYVFKELETLR